MNDGHAITVHIHTHTHTHTHTQFNCILHQMMFHWMMKVNGIKLNYFGSDSSAIFPLAPSILKINRTEKEKEKEKEDDLHLSFK